jgi:endonuclease/exonuclease/phosphatase family metal-dependent hydrolase
MAKKKAATRRKFGILSIIIFVVNCLAILMLLLSYLAVHVSPARNWVLPFFGLTYPYFLMINIIFVVFWAIRLKWVLVFSLIAILAGWNHLGRIFRIAGDNELEPGFKYLKVTSYNVKNLSNDNVDLMDPQVRSNIIHFLDGTGSDIICLQEMMIIHPDPDAFIDSLSQVMGLPYHAYARYISVKKKAIDAIFTFSRYPIIDYGEIGAEGEQNYALYTDIVMDSDTFRLFNIHLASIRLRHEDYNFIAEFDLQFNKDENIRENSMRIFKKFKTAFQTRAGQADLLASAIAASPHPVIVCGDFNDTPNSYVYHRLSHNLTDAFMESGAGFGNTYIGKVPSFRIDNIMHDWHFHSRSFHRDLNRYSDHYPISCYIGWEKLDRTIQ